MHLAPLPRLRARHCRRRTLNGYARREIPSKVSSFPIAPKQPRLFRAWKHFLMMEGVRLRHSFLRERERDSVDETLANGFFLLHFPSLPFFVPALSRPLPPCVVVKQSRNLYVYLALSCYSSRRLRWWLHARLTPSSSSLSRRTKAGFSVAKALLPLQLPGTAFADDREKKKPCAALRTQHLPQ